LQLKDTPRTDDQRGAYSVLPLILAMLDEGARLQFGHCLA
jgi:hypothetical protein